MCKLPAWGTVSTSSLYPMLFSVVGHCRHRWKWIRRALKHSRSRWDHLGIVFRRKVVTASGICPPSWNFWVKEASGDVGIYTSKKTCPNNIGIATETASIFVSLVELLVLPVWFTVSTSGFYLMLFSEVRHCRHRRKWIRRAQKTLPQPLRSPWYRFPSQSYNYFRYLSAILEFLGWRKRRVRLAYAPVINIPQ